MRVPVYAALAMLLASPAAANPIIVKSYPWAKAAPGMEIVPLENTPVRIAAEDLTISPELVRAHYVFANDTTADIDATVAFPLPNVDTAAFWNEVTETGAEPHWPGVFGRHTDDPVNFVGLKVLTDGLSVPARAGQNAIIRTSGGEQDVTAEVISAGLPLLLLRRSDVLDRLPEATRRRLFDAHILGTHDWEWDRSTGKYPGTYYPNWVVRSDFTWKQRFPARGSAVIDVSYQPVAGGTLEAIRGVEITDPLDRFCPDASIRRMLRTRDKVQTRVIEYILTTANAWHGPIGRFHLTLDKLKPDNVLSLCWDGDLKKTGPTTFEAVRKDFAPKQDIHLLVLGDLPTQ